MEKKSLKDNKPVTWQDIKDLQEEYGLPISKLARCFGITHASWTKICSDPQKMKERPPKTEALLYRFYKKYPASMPFTPAPAPRVVFDEIKTLLEERNIEETNKLTKKLSKALRRGKTIPVSKATAEERKELKAEVVALRNAIRLFKRKRHKVFLHHEFAKACGRTLSRANHWINSGKPVKGPVKRLLEAYNRLKEVKVEHPWDLWQEIMEEERLSSGSPKNKKGKETK